MKIYIGTSGWQYHHWQGKFYPINLKPVNYLKFYCQHFNTVEINTTFYNFTKEISFKKWLEATKTNRSFKFSLKIHRFFTHYRRLKLNKDNLRILKTTIQNYQFLDKKLGPILIQLPQNFKKDIDLLRKFIILLRPFIKNNIKFAMEFRHSSWLNEKIDKILKKSKIAFVISDSPQWSTKIIKTTDFIYARFHGKPKLFSSPYQKEELKEWAKRLIELKPREFYIYFNNDFEGYAVKNAFEFKEIFKA